MRLRLSLACDLNSLAWLAGWLADVERCSCIKLLSCKIMSSCSCASPLSCWKSSWIPNKYLELPICSILLLLLLLLAAAAASLLLSLSLLAVSADLNISLLISSITHPAAPMAGPVLAVSSAAKIFGTWADHHDLPCLPLHLHLWPQVATLLQTSALQSPFD
jgi:hypothetical protein